MRPGSIHLWYWIWRPRRWWAGQRAKRLAGIGSATLRATPIASAYIRPLGISRPNRYGGKRANAVSTQSGKIRPLAVWMARAPFALSNLVGSLTDPFAPGPLLLPRFESSGQRSLARQATLSAEWLALDPVDAAGADRCTPSTGRSAAPTPMDGLGCYQIPTDQSLLASWKPWQEPAGN